MGAHAFTDDVWGIELDEDAVATQRAAGMVCEQADITKRNPQDYGWSWVNEPTGHIHLHASPPCQTFSTAGKGDGRKHLDTLSMAVRDILSGGEVGDDIDLSDVPEGSLLVLEPARWISALLPDSISMEQVRSVLPIWEAYADGLEALGYDTWTALLYSEQYGSVATCPLHRNEHAPLATQQLEYETALASVFHATTGAASPNMSVWTAAWHVRDAVASGVISPSHAASLLRPVLAALPTPTGRADAAWTSAATFTSGWTGSTAANISSLLNDFWDGLSDALKSSTTSTESETTTATTTSGSGTATETTPPSTTATIPIESAWCGLCADHATPQTRTRAWLGASLHGTVVPPTPTHSKYHVRKPERLDANVLPWVSMAEALGWGDDDLAGFPRRADNDDIVTIDGVNYRARDFRQGDQPAFGLTEKARSWTHIPDNHSHWRQSSHTRATTRALDEPAGTMLFGHASADMRFTDAEDVGYAKINQADIDRLGEQEAQARYGDRAGSKARRVTVEEAGILQGFPADFPWQGSKTSQFRQVGNAVNPAVAEAVLRSVL